MPIFLCPCCGGAYLVPMANCESLLEQREREGWRGAIGPARCANCQKSLSVGDTVVVRGGQGILPNGSTSTLVEGTTAMVLEVSAWEGEGSIFRIRLPSDEEVYVARAQLGTVRVEGYYLAPGRQATGSPERGTGIGAATPWLRFWKRIRA
jgi:hypothetical protein